MVRFKQFTSMANESLEQTVNVWLSQAQPDVRYMGQSVGPQGTILVCFLYEEGFQASEKRLSQEATAIVEQAMRSRSDTPMLEPLTVEEGNVAPQVGPTRA